MNNKQEILGLIANIALVVLLFCFIVAGLNIIGIYSLPAPIEKLLGTYEDGSKMGLGDDSVLYNSVSFEEGKKEFEAVAVSYEDASALLANVRPLADYTQQLEVTRYFGAKSRKEFLNISFSDGLYSVDFSADDSGLLKRVTEEDGFVTVTEFYGDKSNTVTIEKGSFDINEECGFILSAVDFINSGYNLTEADFLYSETNDGVYVTINFDSSDYGIAQKLTYVISLDRGVVTQASCYENGAVVYEMKTISVSSLQ